MMATHPVRRSARADSEGFVLVAVLWILAALATFVSIYSVYVSSTAIAASVRDDALVAHGLAIAAVELAAYRVVAVPKDKRPTHGEVVFRMGKANVTAVFQNETARIDLNTAPRELLAGLFAVLGARPEAAGQYADRIIAFRSASPSASAGGEAVLYQDERLDYGPRGGPFVHVEELWRVVSLPPALVEQALPHLTVYSGRSGVHAGDADPVVRDALHGGSPQVEDAPGTETQGTVLAGTTSESSDAVRITVRIDFDSGRSRGVEAVILVRDFGDDPYRVLSWREDMHAPPPERSVRTERRS